MQNDYVQLYELIRKRASQLEQSWRSLQTQLKPLDLNAFPELPSAANKNSARRIKPTQLTTSTTLTATLENEEIPCTSMSRPLNNATVAWKKISTPLKSSVVSSGDDEDGEDSSAVLKDFFNALPNREGLHEFAKALHQIIFLFSLDEANRFIFNFASAIGALCKILAVGDEVCAMQPSSKLLNFLSGRGEGELSCPGELLWVGAHCAHLSARQLGLFFPDSLKQLHKNGLLCLFGFNEAFKSSSSTGSLSSVSLLQSQQKNESLAVAYSNLRDSRNFFTDPTAHANQQRIRDLFLNLIRFHLANDYSSNTSTTTTSAGSSNASSSRRGFAGKVAEITGRLVGGGSYGWMAELFLTEYLQVQEMRIDRLEERIKPASTGNDGSNSASTEVFWLFLQQADSFKLTRAIESKAVQSISGLLEAANQRRSTWTDSVRKARFLARAVAFCRYRLDEESLADPSEEDLLVFGWVRGAVEGKWMLTLLPCLFEYFSILPSWGIKLRCQNTVKLLLKYHQIKFQRGRKIKCRSMFLIKMAIGDFLRDCCPSELINELSLELEGAVEAEREPTPTIEDEVIALVSEGTAAFVDEDDSILGVSVAFRSFSAQLKYLHSCFNGIVKINNLSIRSNTSNNNVSSATITNTTTTTTTTTNDTPRKIRPITQVAAAELKHQRLQKQLMQWFWWRYGSQRVLVDALVSFILEQRIYPRYPKTANTLLTRNQNIDDCKKDFKEIFVHFLPLVMPPFWQQNAEMADLFSGLTLELARKQIISHFSEVMEGCIGKGLPGRRRI